MILAQYLILLNEPGFRNRYWCGFYKLAKLIKAYPESFEIYGDSLTDKYVRILNHNENSNSSESTINPGINATFIRTHLSEDNHRECLSQLRISDGLEDFCVFSNYIIYMYYKAEVENKVLIRDNVRLFHLGWFHENTDDVYMLFGYDNDNRPILNFLRRSGRDSRDMIRLFGNQTPEMVHFEVPQFNVSLQIEPEFGHIFDERLDRIPDEIIDMLRRSPSLPTQFRDCGREVIARYCRNFLRRLLTGCIEDTRERLSNRQDEAVPFWFKRTNKMCWLIPLRLGVTEDVNLTLVLEESTLNGAPVYRAHTILALKEAFKCARLLGPVRAEWLRDAWE